MTKAVELAQVASTGVSEAFKNRIINGAMGIWQRGTSFNGVSYSYTTDRWAGLPFTGSQNFTRSSSVPAGFQYSLQIQRPNGSTSTSPTGAIQTIESVNCYDLSNQVVTFSFWARSGANFSAASSQMVAQVWTGTAADQGGVSYFTWTGNATPISAPFTVTSTWTRYSFTGTIGSGVQEMAALFYFSPSGTAGADDSIYVTGVQLEVGSTATNFEYRPYTTELQLCQRYLPAFNSSGTVPIGGGYSFTTTGSICVVTFPVQTRVAPTGISASSASDFQIVAAAAFNATAVSYNSASTTVGYVQISTSSGLTANGGSGGRFINPTGQLLFTGCEL